VSTKAGLLCLTPPLAGRRRATRDGNPPDPLAGAPVERQVGPLQDRLPHLTTKMSYLTYEPSPLFTSTTFPTH
jgi:hypothetical protein